MNLQQIEAELNRLEIEVQARRPIPRTPQEREATRQRFRDRIRQALTPPPNGEGTVKNGSH